MKKYQRTIVWSGRNHKGNDVRDHITFRSSYATVESAIKNFDEEYRISCDNYWATFEVHEAYIIDKETKEVLWTYDAE